jgi:DNA modification methylase
MKPRKEPPHPSRGIGRQAAVDLARHSTPNIEWVAIGALRPAPTNARTHSKRQIKLIARSIERFGFMNPILVDGQHGIIAGHGRWAAAKILGLQKVPTLRFEHLSDADKRAYILADNRIAEKAGWDREILAIELQAFVDMDFDIGITGFEMPEVELILDEAVEIDQPPLSPEDSVPQVPPGLLVVRPGDTWILGAHRLHCGDARDNQAYKALLEGSTAEFVFTDPPYNVPILGNVSGLGRVRHADFAMASGEMSQPEYIAFLQDAIRLLCAHTQDGSIHDICMDWRHAFEMLAAGRSVYRELKNICIWNKANAGMGSFYRSKHELIFIWKSGQGSHINNFELGQHGRSRSNVWDYAGVNSFRPGRMAELAMHPTTKPVALVADAIRDCSRRAGLVLDPFAGSGTTVIAAERTGRKARIIEIDPAYCDLIVRRWQAYTGKLAVHAQSGISFEDLEDQIESSEVAHAQRKRRRKTA